MSRIRACDVCGIPGSPKNPCIAFGLRRNEGQRQPDGRWRAKTTACGGIDLCQECWEKISKPRMRAFRQRKLVAV